jgi:dUTP pyrophosphatase
MKLKVKLDKWAKKPTRAHEHDCGLDLYAKLNMQPTEIPAFGAAEFDTGVHVAIPVGYSGDIETKSSFLAMDVITDGTIDPDYTGSIRIKLFNHSCRAIQIEAGQKIAQLVIKAIITPEVELTDNLEDTERGNGGFGSTGMF